MKKYNQTDPIIPIDASFQCQSGDYNDCFSNAPEESLSESCNGILMFTNKSSSCGENCGNSDTTRNIIRKGWTLFTRYRLNLRTFIFN